MEIASKFIRFSAVEYLASRWRSIVNAASVRGKIPALAIVSLFEDWPRYARRERFENVLMLSNFFIGQHDIQPAAGSACTAWDNDAGD